MCCKNLNVCFPLLGAQTDVEVDNPLNKMSEEEKEAEAEELAKLLSKLNKNGLVKSAAIGPDGKPVELNIEEDWEQTFPDVLLYTLV